MIADRIRVVYRTTEAHTCPRCGRPAVRCDFLGRTVEIVKTYTRCLERFLRTVAFNADHQPEAHAWIPMRKGME
jgi:hypothetical protein